MGAQRLRSHRRAGTIGIGVLAAATLVACSSSTTPSGGSSSAPAAAPDIHVAVLSSYTGAYAQIGSSMWAGAVVGAAAVNAAGGINGSKLVLDKVDTKGDAADAVPVLQQELATNHPVAIVGPTTLEIFGIQPIIDRNQIPELFNGGSTAFDTSTDQWVWRINPSDSQLALAIATYAISKGVTNAAVLFTTEASQQELEPYLVKDYKALGGTVSATVNVTPGQSSYNSEIVKLLASKPQAILGQLDPPTAATFFSQLRGQVGTTLPFIGTDVTAGSDWIKAVGAAYAHAAVTSVQGGTPTNAAGTEFTTLTQSSTGAAPLGGANYTYDGVIDLALAMTYSKNTTNTGITAGLPMVSNTPGTICYTYSTCLALLKAGTKINYDGASGPMDFNANRNVSGPWDVVKADATGAMTTLSQISADQVTAAQAKVG
ncbi:MAG: ABC transporter substrate-binding protein [Actinomycetes bacterium]